MALATTIKKKFEPVCTVYDFKKKIVELAKIIFELPPAALS